MPLGEITGSQFNSRALSSSKRKKIRLRFTEPVQINALQKKNLRCVPIGRSWEPACAAESLCWIGTGVAGVAIVFFCCAAVVVVSHGCFGFEAKFDVDGAGSTGIGCVLSVLF